MARPRRAAAEAAGRKLWSIKVNETADEDEVLVRAEEVDDPADQNIASTGGADNQQDEAFDAAEDISDAGYDDGNHDNGDDETSRPQKRFKVVRLNNAAAYSARMSLLMATKSNFAQGFGDLRRTDRRFAALLDAEVACDDKLARLKSIRTIIEKLKWDKMPQAPKSTRCQQFAAATKAQTALHDLHGEPARKRCDFTFTLKRKQKLSVQQMQTLTPTLVALGPALAGSALLVCRNCGASTPCDEIETDPVTMLPTCNSCRADVIAHDRLVLSIVNLLNKEFDRVGKTNWSVGVYAQARDIAESIPGCESSEATSISVADYYASSIKRSFSGPRAQQLSLDAMFPIFKDQDGNVGAHLKGNMVPTAQSTNMGKGTHAPGGLSMLQGQIGNRESDASELSFDPRKGKKAEL